MSTVVAEESLVVKVVQRVKGLLNRHRETFDFVNNRGDFIHIFLGLEEEAADRVVKILKAAKLNEVQKLYNKRINQWKVICRCD